MGIDFVHRLRPTAPWNSEARYAGPEETFWRMPLRICVRCARMDGVSNGWHRGDRIRK